MAGVPVLSRVVFGIGPQPSSETPKCNTELTIPYGVAIAVGHLTQP
jgi:hypothetical protein